MRRSSCPYAGGGEGDTAVVASRVDMEASCSRGVRMYCRKAALCHRLRAWMVESSTPAKAADVAAPMQKLWPA